MRYLPSRARTAFCALFLLSTLSAMAGLAGPASAAPFSVAGIVLGPDAKPIAGATVAVYDVPTFKPAKSSVQTDAEGRFRVEGERLSPPRETVTEVRNNEPARFTVGVLVTSAGFGLASASLQEGDNTVRLQPGTSLSGVVKNDNDEPVADTLVRLRFISPEDPLVRTNYFPVSVFPAMTELYTARTGADGRWTLKDLPTEGNAQVEVDDTRFVRTYGQATLGPEPVEAPPIKVKPGTTITGRVLYGDGKPAEGITVTANAPAGGSYGQTKTGADGTYTINGLQEGDVNVRADDPKGEWVGRGLEGVATRAGKPTTAPDLTFDRGLMVEGTVIDDETEEPVAGVTIMAQGTYASSRNSVSDAEGRYTLRVLPGRVQLAAINVPPEYIRNEYGGNNNVTVKPDQKTFPPFRLKKGLIVRGTAVDEAGQPAKGVVLTLGREYWGPQATVKENGEWMLGSINPDQERFGPPQRNGGGQRLVAMGEWQVVKPATVILPAERPIEVVVRRIKLVEFTGRVVTPAGEPVPGAQVVCKIAVNPEYPQYGTTFRQKTTDRLGRYRLTQLKPDTSMTVSVKKAGYAFVRGGKVENKAGQISAEDVVLAPMQAHLTGRVVDPDGAPVPDARVTLAGGASTDSGLETQIITDAQGRFTFKNLAEGEATVLAAAGRGFGKSTANTDREATVVLAPGRDAAGDDLARVTALITRWTQEETERDKTAPPGRNQWRPDPARFMSLMFAKRDPDLAMRIAAAPDGTVDDRIMGMLIQRVARRDARRAAAWAPPYLEKMKPGDVRSSATLDLALAVAEVDPALAKQLLESEAATVKAKDFSQKAANKFSSLAALAAKLKDTRAQLWFEALQVAVEQSVPADRKPWWIGTYASSLAKGSPELAEVLIASLESLGQIQALERAVPDIARVNMPLAKRWLARMEELAARPDLPVIEQKDDGMYRPTVQESLDAAYEGVARALAPVDGAAALEVARKIKGERRPEQRPFALALAAQHLQGEAAATAFREAAASARQEYYGADTTSAIAAMAYQQDAALGEELFESARKRLVPRDSMIDNEDMRPSAAKYAFYRAPINPAESRLLLETEWARRKAAEEWAKKNGSAERYSGNSWRLGAIASAMVAVDLERALEMARDVMGYENSYNDLRPTIINYLLTPVNERRTMRLESFMREDAE